MSTYEMVSPAHGSSRASLYKGGCQQCSILDPVHDYFLIWPCSTTARRAELPSTQQSYFSCPKDMSTSEKASDSPRSLSQATHEPRDATDNEIANLPLVVDTLPRAAWVAALVGALERFSYYCIVSIWRECPWPCSVGLC